MYLNRFLIVWKWALLFITVGVVGGVVGYLALPEHMSRLDARALDIQLPGTRNGVTFPPQNYTPPGD